MRKKCIEHVFFCFFFFASFLYARDELPTSYTSEEIAKSLKVSKIYPVPGEDPVYVGGVKLLTPEEVAAAPPLSISFYNPLLPVTFSNINSKYLRPAFSQKGASCAQAAALGYHYTYTINQMRDTDAKQKTNQYNYLFTWNFFNEGVGGGSSFLKGWQLANENGIVDTITWGNNSPTYDTKWLTGYNKYFIGLRNRYVEYNKVNVSTAQGIENLKQWILNLGQVEQKCMETNKTITPNASTVMSIRYTAATEPLAITTSSLPSASMNTPYSTQLQSTGGVSPYTWEVLKNHYFEVTTGSADWQINTAALPLADPDDGLTEVALPFSFSFYGVTYDKIYIATDGNIQFENSFKKIRTRESLIANKTIAVLSSNLYYQPGDSIYYSGDAQKAIIRWHAKHIIDSNSKITHATIETIFKGKLEKGMQKIVWRTGNENTAISNGVYLCKMTAGKRMLVKKIALCR